MASETGITRRGFIGGVTTAAAVPLPVSAEAPPTPATAPFIIRSRGARVPTNLADRIRAQNATSVALSNVIRSDKAFINRLTTNNPRLFSAQPALPAQFDWPNSNRVTPVKDQGSCGSCWAFAAIAAYESAYLIVSNMDAVQNGGGVG